MSNWWSLGRREYRPTWKKLLSYLSSPQWKRIKELHRTSGLPQRCLICGCDTFDLHHRNYDELGRENLGDLLPLCQPHHKEIHAYLNRYNMTLSESARAILSLAGPRRETAYDLEKYEAWRDRRIERKGRRR